MPFKINLLSCCLAFCYSTSYADTVTLNALAPDVENIYQTVQNSFGSKSTEDLCDTETKQHLKSAYEPFLSTYVIEVLANDKDCLKETFNRIRSETKVDLTEHPELSINELNHENVVSKVHFKFSPNGFKVPIVYLDSDVKSFLHIWQQKIESQSSASADNPRLRLSIYNRNGHLKLEFNRIDDLQDGQLKAKFYHVKTLDITDSLNNWFEFDLTAKSWSDNGSITFHLYRLKQVKKNGKLQVIRSSTVWDINNLKTDLWDTVHWSNNGSTTVKPKFGLYAQYDDFEVIPQGSIKFADISYSVEPLVKK